MKTMKIIAAAMSLALAMSFSASPVMAAEKAPKMEKKEKCEHCKRSKKHCHCDDEAKKGEKESEEKAE